LQRLITTTVLVGLLVATAVAFAVTERLKLAKSPVYGTHVYPKTGFSPKCGCARGKTTIQIRLRHADDVGLRILNAKNKEVRDLGTVAAPRGQNVFRWDGRTDGNVIAPDGRYRAELHLARQHRTIILPNLVELDTKPPLVKSVTVNRDVFSPDGDQQADFVRVSYELSKPGHVNLYLGGKRILRTYRHPARGAFSWYGLANGTKLEPGSYTLEVGAVDAAGNSTPTKDRWRERVRLRYIELASSRITVPRGRRFSIGVSTDAKQYAWRLGDRKSVATGPVLRLLASTRHGRYTLTVSEQGHVSRATVIVR
jgi:FlgD Ig-like domain